MTLRFWARSTPDATAIVFQGDHLSYADLSRWVDTVAHDLVDRGVTPGDRVAIVGENCLEWVVVGLAALRAGAVVTGLGNRSPAPELEELCRKTGPVIAFAGATHAERMEAVSKSLPGLWIGSFDEIASLRKAPHCEFKSPQIDPDEPAVIVFSSGTTGLPKGVTFNNTGLLSVIFEWSLMDQAYRRGSKMLGVLPLAPVGGFVNMVLCATVLGATLYLEPRFEPETALRRIIEERINLFVGVITVYRLMASLPMFETADLSCLESAVVGGAPVTIADVQKWQARGASPRQTYGLTECGGCMTWSSAADALAKPDRCGAGAVFRQFRTVRPDGSPCGVNEIGEVVIRGRGIMMKYWSDERSTNETIRDGWLHSGDLGEIDADGDLKIVDRLKDIIISGGFNVAAAEVERIINDLDVVEEVAVIAVPDDKFGQTPGAVVKLRNPATATDIVRYCAAHLADYKVPRRVLIVEAPLPRNANTKLIKPEIRKLYDQALANLEPIRLTTR
jgi:fatty-acyl-CoA synthase